MADEDVIRRRLMIDGDGTGDDRRLNMLMKSFIKWTTADESPEESAATLQRMYAQLDQCEYSMTKSRAASCMITEELENYHKVDAAIEAATEAAKKDIENTKAKLLEAKTVRKNRIEYDVLAKVINDQPDRKETNEKLTQLRDELQSVEKVSKSLDKKLDVRRKELQVLFSSCHRMKQMIDHACELERDNSSEESEGEQSQVNMETEQIVE